MTALLLVLLAGASALELENRGLLPQAGAAWQERDDIRGQTRIMGRLLEEAIYAGHGQRSWILVQELETVCPDTELVKFWRARIAWSAGLSVFAANELDMIDSTDPWLNHRAAGLAALFREDGDTAVEELLRSIASASTTRRKFYSAIDLCSAYLNSGRYEEALALSELLVFHFRGDPIAEVMHGLCLHSNGRYRRAYAVLSGTRGTGAAADSLAGALMEGFEQ